jgi:hypothetical protein
MRFADLFDATSVRGLRADRKMTTANPPASPAQNLVTIHLL